MALSDILTKITEQAEAEAAQLLQGAQAQAVQIVASYKADAAVKAEEVLQKKEEALGGLAAKAESMAERENRMRRLAAKQEIVADVLQGFYDRMVGLPDGEYASFMEKLCAQLPNVPCTILTPAHRVDVLKKHVPVSAEVQASDALRGGFIVKSDTVTIDNSFHNLVFSAFRQQIEQFVAQQFQFVG